MTDIIIKRIILFALSLCCTCVLGELGATTLDIKDGTTVFEELKNNMNATLETNETSTLEFLNNSVRNETESEFRNKNNSGLNKTYNGLPSTTFTAFKFKDVNGNTSEKITRINATKFQNKETRKVIKNSESNEKISKAIENVEKMAKSSNFSHLHDTNGANFPTLFLLQKNNTAKLEWNSNGKAAPHIERSFNLEGSLAFNPFNGNNDQENGKLSSILSIYRPYIEQGALKGVSSLSKIHADFHEASDNLKDAKMSSDDFEKLQVLKKKLNNLATNLSFLHEKKETSANSAKHTNYRNSEHKTEISSMLSRYLKENQASDHLETGEVHLEALRFRSKPIHNHSSVSEYSNNKGSDIMQENKDKISKTISEQHNESRSKHSEEFDIVNKFSNISKISESYSNEYSNKNVKQIHLSELAEVYKPQPYFDESNYTTDTIISNSSIFPKTSSDNKPFEIYKNQSDSRKISERLKHEEHSKDGNLKFSEQIKDMNSEVSRDTKDFSKKKISAFSDTFKSEKSNLHAKTNQDLVDKEGYEESKSFDDLKLHEAHSTKESEAAKNLNSLKQNKFQSSVTDLNETYMMSSENSHKLNLESKDAKPENISGSGGQHITHDKSSKSASSDFKHMEFKKKLEALNSESTEKLKESGFQAHSLIDKASSNNDSSVMKREDSATSEKNMNTPFRFELGRIQNFTLAKLSEMQVQREKKRSSDNVQEGAFKITLNGNIMSQDKSLGLKERGTPHVHPVGFVLSGKVKSRSQQAGNSNKEQSESSDILSWNPMLLTKMSSFRLHNNRHAIEDKATNTKSLAAEEKSKKSQVNSDGRIIHLPSLEMIGETSFQGKLASKDIGKLISVPNQKELPGVIWKKIKKPVIFPSFQKLEDGDDDFFGKLNIG